MARPMQRAIDAKLVNSVLRDSEFCKNILNVSVKELSPTTNRKIMVEISIPVSENVTERSAVPAPADPEILSL